MGKSPKKTTEMTANEMYELNHFSKLSDIKSDDWYREMGKKVWVRMGYGILRGEVESIDLITDRVNVALENGKYISFYNHKEIRKNWIKERS